MSNITVQNIPAPLRPRDYSASQLALIKRTVAKDCNNEEFDMFTEICKRQGLDPFRRQIYAFVFNKDKPDKRQFVTVTGIDGYRAIAKRTGTYRPSETEAVIEFDESLKDADSNPLGIKKATVIVNQFGPDKQWYPIAGTAKWDEFAPIDEGFDLVDKGEKWPDGNSKKTRVPNGKKKLTKDNWLRMPEVMISKCAEAQALRKGWPEEYSGLYVTEELDAAQSEITASEIIEDHEKELRLIAVNGVNSYPLIFNFSEGIEMIQSGILFDKVMEHIRSLGTKSEIEVWKNANRMGLQQYWAKEKNDALELKKQIEQLEKSKPEFSTDLPNL